MNAKKSKLTDWCGPGGLPSMTLRSGDRDAIRDIVREEVSMTYEEAVSNWQLANMKRDADKKRYEEELSGQAMNYDQIVGDTLAESTRLQAELESANAEIDRLRRKCRDEAYSADVSMRLDLYVCADFNVASSGPESLVLRDHVPARFYLKVDDNETESHIYITEVKYIAK